MEYKIGEIFEFGGEWLQCVEQPEKYDKTVCAICAFQGNGKCELDRCSETYRSDKKSVIFKKLEKVGEPFTFYIHGDERLVWMQEYKLYDVNFCKGNALLMYVSDYKHKRIAMEIQQTKEDMEGKKLNLKPFELEAAKAGKPVCTRDGRKARIICFDAKGKQPIIALFEREKADEVIIQTYNDDGSYYGLEKEDNRDLMMLLEKKEAWVNLYPCDCMGQKRYPTKEEALKNAVSDVIATVKIEWEE